MKLNFGYLVLCIGLSTVACSAATAASPADQNKMTCAQGIAFKKSMIVLRNRLENAKKNLNELDTLCPWIKSNEAPYLKQYGQWLKHDATWVMPGKLMPWHGGDERWREHLSAAMLGLVEDFSMRIIFAGEALEQTCAAHELMNDAVTITNIDEFIAQFPKAAKPKIDSYTIAQEGEFLLYAFSCTGAQDPYK